MGGKVIQASFLTAHPKLPPPEPARLSPPIQAKTAVRLPGPPAPAFASRSPGPPAPALSGRSGVVQRRGAGGAFAVEAGQLGLASGGGKPLPDAVRGKMEAALGADFSAVRVHVGPQAERIGAIAFTVGSDIYFAPNRYQPDTVQGQQLLGHELAHVVQQRAGRVRNPFGSGVAVVQDRALEAEADRLGQRAAAHRTIVQAKLATLQLPRSFVKPNRTTLQRASSSKGGTSLWEDMYFAYALTERERTNLSNGAIMPVGEPPIHGSFSASNLSADLHVSAAQPGMDVNKKLKDALNKIKYYMEYAAAVKGKNVHDGAIEMRPTGGVVVKQMVELLAFVGRSISEKLSMKKKLDQLKELRKERIQKALAQIEYLKVQRSRQLDDTGGTLILSLISQHPEVEESPSPGMAELIRRAKSLREEYDSRIKELEAFVGDRQGHAMGGVFFDEHFYMLESLIDRGRAGYFSVSAYGLVNELDQYDPHLQEIATNKNVVLMRTPAGGKARKIYTKRLQEQRASLLVTIYYDAISDVIATIP